MFSGIVQGTAIITSVVQREDILTIEVDLGGKLVQELAIGASVAVDGVCLTAVNIDGGQLKFGDEIGGHVVSGHVSGCATVKEVENGEKGRTLLLSCHEDEIGYLMNKGFVALDGISLTVGEVNRDDSTFDVHLIPETLAVTTIAYKDVGDQLNLELDATTVAAVEAAKQMLADRG